MQRCTMPTDLDEATTGGASLIFPDDAEGVRFRLNEAAVYDADEVRDELGAGDDGTPAFGRWLSVEIEDEDCWLNAPGEVIEELQRIEAEPGEVLEVSRLEKSGNGETDPFEANISRKADADQTRL